MHPPHDSSSLSTSKHYRGQDPVLGCQRSTHLVVAVAEPAGGLTGRAELRLSPLLQLGGTLLPTRDSKRGLSLGMRHVQQLVLIAHGHGPSWRRAGGTRAPPVVLARVLVVYRNEPHARTVSAIDKALRWVRVDGHGAGDISGYGVAHRSGVEEAGLQTVLPGISERSSRDPRSTHRRVATPNCRSEQIRYLCGLEVGWRGDTIGTSAGHDRPRIDGLGDPVRVPGVCAERLSGQPESVSSMQGE